MSTSTQPGAPTLSRHDETQHRTTQHGGSGAEPARLTASVVVATYERPNYLARCLEHLANQHRMPDEVIVADASRDAGTERLVKSRFPQVLYQWNPLGYGHIAGSREIGYRGACGDVVAFVDDDAFAEPSWLEHLLEPYTDDRVGGVGGRTLNGQPGEVGLPRSAGHPLCGG